MSALTAEPAWNAWLLQAAALFLLTFAHEDVAIIAAAFSRVEYGLPLVIAFASVYCGIVASDIAIYALGRGAQRWRWLRDRIVGPRVEHLHARIDRHLLHLVALCRITPGLLFPTFVAAGWFRIPLRRFALASLVSAAAYTPIAMTLVTLLGAVVLQRIGLGAWAAAMAIVIVLVVRGIWRVPGAADDDPGNVAEPLTEAQRYRGMPALPERMRGVARAEHIPQFLFYLPIAVHWLWLGARYRSLSLPSIANPLVHAGGYWDESKSALMDAVGADQRQWIAPYVALERSRDGGGTQCALERMRERGLTFPIVVKPDIGWQGYGVRRVDSAAALRAYIVAFPPGARMVLQTLVPHDGEAGVYYMRHPESQRGRVTALTLRYYPLVIGDGGSSVAELIERDARAGWKAGYYLGQRQWHQGLTPERLRRVPAAGERVRLAFIASMRVGGLYRDASDAITPALSARFDDIARSIPAFHFGRFDIRFASFDTLRAGAGFSIIEINGAGAEAIQVWDPERPLGSVYQDLMRTQAQLFEIGAANRAQGFHPMGVGAFLRAAWHQHRLIVRYPESD